MAEISPSRRRRAVIDHIRVPKKWPDREPSPDPIRIWRRESAKDDEPDPETPEAEDDGGSGGSCGGGGRGILTAHVLYYLSVNSQLQHPHFIEVPLSSSQGLYLRDFTSRLEQLRGKGMTSIYSWSSKRRYKNGFVWHDLTEDDLIWPSSNGNEYVLKGSEILGLSPPSCISSYHALSSFSSPSEDFLNSKALSRRRNQSMNSIDFRKYRAERLADASTQTSDWMRRQSHTSASIQEDLKDDDGIQPELQLLQAEGQSGEELSKEETSPPPLDSSPETLVTLMKSHRSLMLCPAEERRGSSPPGGRPRGASSLLLQLISCGALLFKDGRAHSYSRS